MLTKRELLHAALATATFSTSKSSALAQLDRPGVFATTRLIEEGLIYGFPIVMNYATMYAYAVDRSSRQFKAAFNKIKNDSHISVTKDTAAALPNGDAVYSWLWMDLRAEPIVLSVPRMDPRRYYSVLLCDGNLYNYGYIGSRATGSEAGDYMVAGPDWNGEPPVGIKKTFRSTTQFSIAIYRTQLFNEKDVGNVKNVQAGYEVATLSRRLNLPSSRQVETIKFPEIDNKKMKRNFFQYLAFAIQFAPSQIVEMDIHAKLARLGVGPGRTFDSNDLSVKERLEMAVGMSAGYRKIDRAIGNSDIVLDGWSIAGYFGDSTFYNGNWLLRAARARKRMFGDDPAEAVFLFSRVDARGESLDGRKYNYAMTFSPGRLPPVNAFWSLTMYDGVAQLFIKNPINRYLINSQMLPTIKLNSDEGLTIYIQHKSPGADRESNWLPAPKGPMLLVLRMYWPRSETPSILPIGNGSWQPPPIERLPQEVR